MFIFRDKFWPKIFVHRNNELYEIPYSNKIIFFKKVSIHSFFPSVYIISLWMSKIRRLTCVKRRRRVSCEIGTYRHDRWAYIIIIIISIHNLPLTGWVSAADYRGRHLTVMYRYSSTINHSILNGPMANARIGRRPERALRPRNCTPHGAGAYSTCPVGARATNSDYLIPIPLHG